MYKPMKSRDYLRWIRPFGWSLDKGKIDLKKFKKIPTDKKFQRLVDEHWKIAMDEIGPIKPWFDPEVNAWVFEHELYPESYGGDTVEEVIERYPLYLKQFIEHRLIGDLAPSVEERTLGRGGKREGAGRPVGTTKEPTRTVRLPVDIVNWIKADPKHLEQVRKLAVH